MTTWFLFLKPRILLILVLCSLHLTVNPALAQTPVSVIFDTDISSDVDDVGAVAVLHALANKGEVDILGMMVSSGDPWSVPCLIALNTWFGSPDIPVGKVQGESVQHESKYTREIAKTYPHNFGEGSKETDAVPLYRQLLAEQPDNSITIITVGYLTNLAGLLQSRPDTASPLNGVDLITRKVKQLVCMGGKYPSGREWNFYQDSKAAAQVIAMWPRSILFLGYESGASVLTGSRLKQIEKPNPISRSYKLYNNLTDRPSWDQLAVLFGVLRQKSIDGADYFTVQRGINRINADGSNIWVNTPDGSHEYVINLQSNSRLKTVIETLMVDAVEQILQSH